MKKRNAEKHALYAMELAKSGSRQNETLRTSPMHGGKWMNSKGDWKRESSLRDVLFPILMLLGVVVVVVVLDFDTYINEPSAGTTNASPQQTPIARETDDAIEVRQADVAVRNEDSYLATGGEPETTLAEVTAEAPIDENIRMRSLSEWSQDAYVSSSEGEPEGDMGVMPDAYGESSQQSDTAINDAYVGDVLMEYANDIADEASAVQIKLILRQLLNEVPLPHMQRENLIKVVENAVMLGPNEQNTAVTNKIVLSAKATQVAFAQNSIIVVDAPLRISSASNNIVISSGDVSISADGKKGGSLVISKGETHIAGAYGSAIYSLDGLKVSYPQNVITFNTKSLDGKDYVNTTIPSLFILEEQLSSD